MLWLNLADVLGAAAFVLPYAGQTSIKLALLDTLSYLLLGVVTAWLLRKRTP
jgi:hypothetical protein